MAVPKRKTSVSKRNMRRSHDSLKKINVILDKESGEPRLSNQIDFNSISKEISDLVFKTIDISKLSNLNALNQIRKLNLDIIIDVMGYTSRNRIGLFKNRIAKKQVLWMGYCNTSGLQNMDYIITDPNLIYKDEKNLYTEEVLYLP